MNMDFELIARLVLFIPLLFATYQVAMLSRILTSLAWRFLMLGFITFAILTALVMLLPIHLFVRLGISLLGYSFVVTGLHFLRTDLKRITGGRRRIQIKEGRTMALVISKSLFTSKGFWLGVVQILIGLLDLVKTNVLESEVAAWGAVASGVITIIVRLVTKQPVSLRGGEPVQVPNSK